MCRQRLKTFSKIKLLQKINFSDKDELLVCGDVIDKGQDSVKLLRLMKAMSNCQCIIGNHEYEFLKYYWAIMQSSPEDFDAVLQKLQAYFPHDGSLLDWDMVDWLENLPDYIERDSFICVHAGVPLDENNRCVALSKATREELVYDRRFKDSNVVPLTDKCIFFGHTPTSYISNQSKIIRYKWDMRNTRTIQDYYKIHLDLGVWLHGELGCFCVENCTEYYVNKWD